MSKGESGSEGTYGDVIYLGRPNANQDHRLQPADIDYSYIWIDAICINQDDIKERSVQVAQMGLTFCQAKQTIVCLTEPRYEAARAAAVELPQPRYNPNELLRSLAPEDLYDLYDRYIGADFDNKAKYTALRPVVLFYSPWSVHLATSLVIN
ncbi:hypothetical protein LTR78_003298 [Recurvomyces mirabilis]|uniref:Heterokaryon incompatibility domain-containing protein n=1 Tax=Recurvomyces mirabilis TaxID=574656 RepID=A0AAE0WSM5_9PEZI|nr:hypothetical protein LTR78_003298 [Recurvomyces mirabilis]KAK5156886.1 hypothetical protein LTS14_004403 [Recurvomyces mirabilis]